MLSEFTGNNNYSRGLASIVQHRQRDPLLSELTGNQIFSCQLASAVQQVQQNNQRDLSLSELTGNQILSRQLASAVQQVQQNNHRDPSLTECTDNQIWPYALPSTVEELEENNQGDLSLSEFSENQTWSYELATSVQQVQEGDELYDFHNQLEMPIAPFLPAKEISYGTESMRLIENYSCTSMESAIPLLETPSVSNNVQTSNSLNRKTYDPGQCKNQSMLKMIEDYPVITFEEPKNTITSDTTDLLNTSFSSTDLMNFDITEYVLKGEVCTDTDLETFPKVKIKDESNVAEVPDVPKLVSKPTFQFGGKKIDMKAGRYIIDEDDDNDEVDVETTEDCPVLESKNTDNLLFEFEALDVNAKENMKMVTSTPKKHSAKAQINKKTSSLDFIDLTKPEKNETINKQQRNGLVTNKNSITSSKCSKKSEGTIPKEKSLTSSSKQANKVNSQPSEAKKKALQKSPPKELINRIKSSMQNSKHVRKTTIVIDPIPSKSKKKLKFDKQKNSPENESNINILESIEMGIQHTKKELPPSKGKPSKSTTREPVKRKKLALKQEQNLSECKLAKMPRISPTAPIKIEEPKSVPINNKLQDLNKKKQTSVRLMAQQTERTTGNHSLNNLKKGLTSGHQTLIDGKSQIVPVASEASQIQHSAMISTKINDHIPYTVKTDSDKNNGLINKTDIKREKVEIDPVSSVTSDHTYCNSSNPVKEEDEKVYLDCQPLVKNPDGKLMVSLLKSNTKRDSGSIKKKLNLEEYKKRHNISTGQSDKLKKFSSIDNRNNNGFSENNDDRVKKHEEKMRKMSEALLKTVPKSQKSENSVPVNGMASTRKQMVASNYRQLSEAALALRSPEPPEHLEKRKLVSIGVNTDYWISKTNIPAEKLPHIKPILEKAGGKLSENSLFTALVKNIPKADGKNRQTETIDQRENFEIFYLRKDRVRPQTKARSVQTTQSLPIRLEKQGSLSSCCSSSSVGRNSPKRGRGEFSGYTPRSLSSRSSPVSYGSYSGASSSSRASSRSSCSNHYRSMNETEREKARREYLSAVDERRIIFVGRISPTTTREDLRRKFCRFGTILSISLHFRHRNSYLEHYGFVTYKYMIDAHEAFSHGNDDRTFPSYDISFGGRRQFCESKRKF
ncbi:hypothetical protein ABEB36_009066 [Hypothenemus hampei]|uniref:RRM domain-containing protein n=1 Tax=Hypothenemus hampei TaxID=57062 RepID=A0ABD1EPJ8_HYPHA